jgi:hypothetical protein
MARCKTRSTWHTSLRASPSSAIAERDAASPQKAAEWFATLSVPWWIAGGRAIDLFLGRDTRTHQDLDVGVLRRDVGTVLRSLPEWKIFEAKDGVLTPLPHGGPRSSVNSLWCRPKGERSWRIELMLDESDGELWVYRRDPEVRRALRDLMKRSSSGIPYLAPGNSVPLQGETRAPARRVGLSSGDSGAQ